MADRLGPSARHQTARRLRYQLESLTMSTDLTIERYKALEEWVTSRCGKGRWLVLTHDNPDPDSIAAADALALLLRSAFRRPVTIAYGGIIGRAENQEMVRLLKIRMSPLRRLRWDHYKHFALVDTQPGTGNNQLPADILPDLVIDHHPVRRKTYQARLHDVRPNYGASATILGEYLMASGTPITKPLATSLAYAIRTETQEFAREFGPPDRVLYEQLMPLIDRRLLARIQSPRVPLDYFQTLHQALEKLTGFKTLIISHMARVPQPDIVPEVADLLLRLEGKTWSLCSGVFEQRLYLSIRTTNPRGNAGHVMRRLLGRRGKGGGHGMMAGGWLPLPTDASTSEIKALQGGLSQRLAKALRKDPAKIQPLLLVATQDVVDGETPTGDKTGATSPSRPATNKANTNKANSGKTNIDKPTPAEAKASKSNGGKSQGLPAKDGHRAPSKSRVKASSGGKPRKAKPRAGSPREDIPREDIPREDIPSDDLLNEETEL